MRIAFLLILLIGTVEYSKAQINPDKFDSLYHANLEKCDQLIKRQDYAGAKRALWSQINSTNRQEFNEVESQFLDKKSEWLDSALIYKQYYVAADRKLEKVSLTTHHKISSNPEIYSGLKSLYAAALYRPYSLRKGIIHKQILNLPSDTIEGGYGRPLQVFMEGKGYNWTLLRDTNALRFVKDSSLFNGKYVIRTNNKFGYELDVYNYSNGKMAYRYKEGYQTGNYSTGTKPKFKTWTNFVNDTTITYTLYEDLNKLNISYRSHFGSNSNYSYKRFDNIPVLAEYFESTTIKDSESGLDHYTSKNYHVNNEGDTTERIYIGNSLNLDKWTIRVNKLGDTTELKMTKKDLIDGLNYNVVRMTNPINGMEIISKSRLLWKLDTLLDVLNPDAMFLDKQSNIISKGEFIKLVNSKDNSGVTNNTLWEVGEYYVSPIDFKVQEFINEDVKLDSDLFVMVYQFGINQDKKIALKKNEKISSFVKQRNSIYKKTELYLFN